MKKACYELPSGDRGRCGTIPAGDAKPNRNFCDLLLIDTAKCFFLLWKKCSLFLKRYHRACACGSSSNNYEICYYPKMEFKEKIFIIRENHGHSQIQSFK